MASAGYSGTPLPRKLGLASGQRIYAVDPPKISPRSSPARLAHSNGSRGSPRST